MIFDPKAKIGKKIKELRLQAGLTQKQLADLLNVDFTTISAYESGRIRPSLRNLLKLSQIFSVPADAIIGKNKIDQNKKENETVEFLSLTNPIPIYNGARAGNEPCFPDSAKAVEWLSMPVDVNGKAGIIVRGDSMVPEINEGDIVIINPDLKVYEGDRVVVVLADKNGKREGAVVKIFRRRNNLVYLMSLNPAYEPIVITSEEEVQFFAKVVSVIKRYR